MNKVQSNCSFNFCLFLELSTREYARSQTRIQCPSKFVFQTFALTLLHEIETFALTLLHGFKIFALTLLQEIEIFALTLCF